MPDFYYLVFPENWNLPTPDKEIAQHHVFLLRDTVLLSPVVFNASSVSLENLDTLIKEFQPEKIHIPDRVKSPRPLSVRDHINGSGLNFLRGNTPYRDKPQFPDMSHIYEAHSFGPGEIVFTVGPERFGSQKTTHTVISETIGIISPLWHYLDLPVSGYGVPVPNAQSFFDAKTKDIS